MIRKYFWSLFLFLELIAMPVFGGQLETREVRAGGLIRTYLVYTPDNLAQPAPVVFAFHGGGGTAWGMLSLTHFDAVADAHGFLLVLPEGHRRHWNDGRKTGTDSDANDIAFFDAMVGSIESTYSIDQRRLYVTGMSNGAIFAHHLAASRAAVIAAIAPVAGGIPAPDRSDFRPAAPVAVLAINGTSDPIVNYYTGAVLWGRQGYVLPPPATIQLWINADGSAPSPKVVMLPDSDPQDGCQEQLSTWSGGHNGTVVELCTIFGGGHTWPGGTQYLPQFIIGAVCRDFDASELISQFFADHPKQ